MTTLSFSDFLKGYLLPTNLKPKPMALINKKHELLEVYRKELNEEERAKAVKDAHSKRSPRWCGITIHVGINCPYNCAYCYIEDMGFKHRDWKPYPLNGKELVYAVLNNPAFYPGKLGTLIAIGSVTEPLANREHFLDYLEKLARLGNPIQFSTKSYIDEKLSKKISEINKSLPSEINPLITIVTFESYKSLEKGAPPPDKRLKTIENLANAGLKPVLFLRPIIPGINMNEIEQILREAKEHGAFGVVFGSLRVTKRTVKKLEDLGFDTREILKRVKKLDDRQRSINLPEKEDFIKLARKAGLIPWKSTCCANSWNSNVPCPSVCFIDGPTTRCPNLCSYPRNSANDEEIKKALTTLGLRFKIGREYIIIKNRPFKGVEFAVRTLTRRAVKLVGKRKK